MATHIRKTFKTAHAKRDELARIAIELDMKYSEFSRAVKAWFQDFVDIRREFETEQAFFMSVSRITWER